MGLGSMGLVTEPSRASVGVRTGPSQKERQRERERDAPGLPAGGSGAVKTETVAANGGGGRTGDEAGCEGRCGGRI